MSQKVKSKATVIKSVLIRRASSDSTFHSVAG